MKKNIISIAIQWWPYLFLSAAIFLFYAPILSGKYFFGLHDPGVYFYPVYNLFKIAPQQLTVIPHWNGYILSGFPSYLSIAGFYYPLHFLYYFFNVIDTYNWLLYFHFVLLASLIFHLAKKLNISTAGGLIVSLSYTLSSFITQWGQNSINYNTFWMLPALIIIQLRLKDLYYIEQRRAMLARISIIVLSAIIIGIGWVGGSPQFVLYISTGVGISGILLDVFFAPRKAFWLSRFKITYSVIAAIILSSLIGLYQMMSAIRFLPFTHRAEGISYEVFQESGLRLLNLTRVLWPYFELHPISDWSGAYLFFGVLPLLFCIYALKRCRADWRVAYFAFLFIFFLLMSFESVPLRYLWNIPPYIFFRGWERWWFIALFGMTFLAGIGYDAVKQKGNTLKFTRYSAEVIALLVVIISTLSDLIIQYYKLPIIEIRLSIAHYAYAWFRLMPPIPYTFTDFFTGLNLAASIFVILAVLMFVILHTSQRSRKWIEVIIVLIVFANLYYAQDFRWVSRGALNKVPKTVQIIKQADAIQDSRLPYRIYFYDRGYVNHALRATKLTNDQKWAVATESLAPNTNMYYGIESVEGYENYSPTKYDAFLGQLEYVDDTVEQISLQPSILFHLSQLNSMNVKYLISPTPLDHPQLEEIGTSIIPSANLTLYVYRNVKAYERMRWRSGNADNITISKSGSGYYQATVSTSVADTLILAENNLPGWKAYIDGSPTKIYDADQVYQSLVVPAGKHEIIWKYTGVLD